MQRLDFDTLEKVGNEYISNELLKRSNDLVWRLKLNGEQWLYVYVMLEFQSSNDRWMALRLMTYIGLLYQDLVKAGQLTEYHKLPPVFPLVIHNGLAPWHSPMDIRELIEQVPGDLGSYSPSLRYFLLDESRQATDGPRQSNNFAADLIDLECCHSVDEVLKVVQRLQSKLLRAEHRPLADAFRVWLQAVLFKRLFSEEDIPKLDSFEEVTTVLAERVDQWRADIERKAAEKSRIECRFETTLKIVLRQAELRFGPLSLAQRERFGALSETELETATDLVLSATALEALFPRDTPRSP